MTVITNTNNETIDTINISCYYCCCGYTHKTKNAPPPGVAAPGDTERPSPGGASIGTGGGDDLSPAQPFVRPSLPSSSSSFPAAATILPTTSSKNATCGESTVKAYEKKNQV